MVHVNMENHIKGVIGCGLFFALIAGAFGGDETMQWAMFAFGATYGNLWIAHD